MDSKILCVSLLLAVFCLGSIEAGSPAEHDDKYLMDVEWDKGNEDTRSSINSNRAKVAGCTAKKYANKAKTKEVVARLYSQCAKDRDYQSRLYRKLALKYKQRAEEMSQLCTAETSRIGGHQAREKDWEAKGREARTQCKQEELRCQELYTKSREAKKSAILACTKAGIHSAQANVYSLASDRAMSLAKDARRKAEIMSNDAKNHYTRSMDDKNKAAGEKVKATQQARDSQRHHAAAMSYEQEALRIRMNSRNNMMKYMQNSLLAERHQSLSKEHCLKADMEEKLATDFARMSEDTCALERCCISEANTYGAKAKRDQTKAYEYGESKKMMGAEIADASEQLYMAQAKDEKDDEENQKLAIYPAEDPVKAMPSEDKNPMFSADEGMS